MPDRVAALRKRRANLVSERNQRIEQFGTSDARVQSLQRQIYAHDRLIAKYSGQGKVHSHGSVRHTHGKANPAWGDAHSHPEMKRQPWQSPKTMRENP